MKSFIFFLITLSSFFSGIAMEEGTRSAYEARMARNNPRFTQDNNNNRNHNSNCNNNNNSIEAGPEKPILSQNVSSILSALQHQLSDMSLQEKAAYIETKIIKDSTYSFDERLDIVLELLIDPQYQNIQTLLLNSIYTTPELAFNKDCSPYEYVTQDAHYQFAPYRILAPLFYQKDRVNRKELFEGIDQENIRNLRLILASRTVDLDLPNEKRTPPLVCIMNPSYAESLRWQIAQDLLNHGANPNTADGHGQSALMLASYHGHDKTIQVLLNNNADVNIKDIHGGTALMCAAISNHLKIAQTLLRYHADQNIQAENGDTALAMAIKKGNKEIIKLLQSNPNNNRQDNKGLTTPDNGHFDGLPNKLILKIISEFMNHLPTNRGEYKKMTKDIKTLKRLNSRFHKLVNSDAVQIPLLNISKEFIQVAFKENRTPERLLDWGTRDETLPIEALAYKYDIPIVIAMHLKSNPNFVNKMIDCINTPLMFAARYNSIKTAKLLFKYGAKTGEQGGDGWTALMEAALGNSLKVARELCLHKEDINAKDALGVTALILAAQRDSFDVARFLLDRGARINDRDKSGRTALMHAIGKNSLKVAALLLERKAYVDATDDLWDYARTEEMQQLLQRYGIQPTEKKRTRNPEPTSYAPQQKYVLMQIVGGPYVMVPAQDK